MSNESSNLPTAAVISDRQATGGSDMATSPTSACKSQANYKQINGPRMEPAAALEKCGHRPRTQPDTSTTPVGGGRTGGPLPGNRQSQASRLAVGSVPTAGKGYSDRGSGAFALPVHVLCDDPYAWFSQRGQRLHSVSIGILPSPRSNGVLYTGTFNIDGFIYTVGSPSIDGLYYEAMAKRCRHLQGIERRQQRKRVRCAARYRERYPDACLPKWLAPSENFS